MNSGCCCADGTEEADIIDGLVMGDVFLLLLLLLIFVVLLLLLDCEEDISGCVNVMKVVLISFDDIGFLCCVCKYYLVRCGFLLY